MLSNFTHVIISSFSYLMWKFAGEKSEAYKDKAGEWQSWALNLGLSNFTALWSQWPKPSFKQTVGSCKLCPYGCLCEVLDGRHLIRFIYTFSTAPSTGRGAWWGRSEMFRGAIVDGWWLDQYQYAHRYDTLLSSL